MFGHVSNVCDSDSVYCTLYSHWVFKSLCSTKCVHCTLILLYVETFIDLSTWCQDIPSYEGGYIPLHEACGRSDCWSKYVNFSWLFVTVWIVSSMIMNYWNFIEILKYCIILKHVVFWKHWISEMRTVFKLESSLDISTWVLRCFIRI